MHSITISTRLIALITIPLAVALAFWASDALGSSDTPDEVVLGDINCDGLVNERDALGALRHTLGFEVAQEDPCFEVGSVAAIPGPSGQPGPSGAPGPSGVPGPAGITLFANVTGDGTLEDGNATDVTRTFEGVYVVEFAQNVNHCAATANVGATEDGLFWPTAIAAVNVAPNANNVVRVGFQSSDAMGHDTDFHLIVVC
jgi:hypothetical protein